MKELSQAACYYSDGLGSNLFMSSNVTNLESKYGNHGTTNLEVLNHHSDIIGVLDDAENAKQFYKFSTAV